MRSYPHRYERANAGAMWSAREFINTGANTGAPQKARSAIPNSLSSWSASFCQGGLDSKELLITK